MTAVTRRRTAIRFGRSSGRAAIARTREAIAPSRVAGRAPKVEGLAPTSGEGNGSRERIVRGDGSRATSAGLP